MTLLRFIDPLAEFDPMLSPFGTRWRGGMMPLDAWEKDGVYTLRFDLPGIHPDAVDITVEGNVLTVTAERASEETDGATWLLRERPAGTHRREVRLGDRLDTTKVSANHSNGVLTVTIPIRQEARPQKVTVQAGAARSLEAARS